MKNMVKPVSLLMFPVDLECHSYFGDIWMISGKTERAHQSIDWAIRGAGLGHAPCLVQLIIIWHNYPFIRRKEIQIIT